MDTESDCTPPPHNRYVENKGGKMTRQLARQSITLDELETLRGNNPHLLFGVKATTINSWMARHPDKLSPKKKIHNYSSKGGRPRILISRSELQSFLEIKRANGRPRKIAV